MAKKIILIIVLFFLNFLFHFYLYKKEIQNNRIPPQLIHPNFQIIIFPEKKAFIYQEKQGNLLPQTKINRALIIKFKDWDNNKKTIRISPNNFIFKNEWSLFLKNEKKEKELITNFINSQKEKITIKWERKTLLKNQNKALINLEINIPKQRFYNSSSYLATTKEILLAYKHTSNRTIKFFYLINFFIFNVLILLISLKI